MFRLSIQPDSEVSPSQQLVKQIQFAIASCYYTPGQRLPSTRQLAGQLKIHRNTVSRAYQLLETAGLVEFKKGSGIYVKPQEKQLNCDLNDCTPAQKIVSQAIENLLIEGCNLLEIKELFLTAIEWRLGCLENLIVTAPNHDLESGELIYQELSTVLNRTIELVALENLNLYLKKVGLGTVITSRYFTQEVAAVIADSNAHLLPVDIYDYQKELAIIKQLPQGVYLGLVSLSKGTLDIAEKIIKSVRKDEIVVITAQAKDNQKLSRVVRSSQVIISDRPSSQYLQSALAIATDELICTPRLIWIDNYINPSSINLLQKLNI